MQRKLFLMGALIGALLLAGCSALQSEAYKAGYSVGEEMKNLGDWAEVLDSWYPDSDGEPLDSSQYEEYCKGVWPIAGPTSGLKNTPDNKSDFIDGCVDGARP